MKAEGAARPQRSRSSSPHPGCLVPRFICKQKNSSGDFRTPSNGYRQSTGDGDAVAILDQRILPHQEKFLRCTTPEQVIGAIKTMAIRSWPWELAPPWPLVPGLSRPVIQKNSGEISGLRHKSGKGAPTGQNWLGEKVVFCCRGKPQSGYYRTSGTHFGRGQRHSDRRCCLKPADRKVGTRSCAQGGVILTYCNAGALATADYGTAVGVIRRLSKQPTIGVFACETAAIPPGCQLTAFELIPAGHCLLLSLLTMPSEA